jgi:hypothetical protein
MAIAGRGGSVGAISTVINSQQESYHVDIGEPFQRSFSFPLPHDSIETGIGGTAKSTEIAGDTYIPDDSRALGLHRISGVHEGPSERVARPLPHP